MDVLWLKVFLLQALVGAVAVAMGVLLVKLDLKTAILAVLLVCPVPFRTITWNGGFLFMADFVAFWHLFQVLLGRAGPTPRRGRGLVFLVLIAVLLLPMASTALGWMTDIETRTVKTVALGLMRGVGYTSLFHMFMQKGYNWRNVSGIAATQILMFTGICVLGLVQAAVGLDLDYWNSIFRLDPSSAGLDYGGGFMGLYRGAVGAWAIGIFAVIPLAGATQRRIWWIMPVCAVVIFGAVLIVGSRQGALIGVLALCLSFMGLVGVGTTTGRLWMLAKAGIGVAILAAGAWLAWDYVAPEKMQDFVSKRFEQLAGYNEAVTAAETRMKGAPVLWEHINSNMQMFTVGAGYGGEDYDGVPTSPVRVVMLDGEFLYVWQLGGVVLLATYFFMLFRIRWGLRARAGTVTIEEQTFLRAARVVLYTGMLLLYGHFFILNVYPAEAPIAYWVWGILGLGMGISLRSADVSNDTYATVESDTLPELVSVGL